MSSLMQSCEMDVCVLAFINQSVVDDNGVCSNINSTDTLVLSVKDLDALIVENGCACDSRRPIFVIEILLFQIDPQVGLKEVVCIYFSRLLQQTRLVILKDCFGIVLQDGITNDGGPIMGFSRTVKFYHYYSLLFCLLASSCRMNFFQSASSAWLHHW